MRKNTLPRTFRAAASVGWSHPYGHGPFAPYLYADGGDGGDPAGGAPAAGDGGDPPPPSGTPGTTPPAPAPAAGDGDGGEDISSLPDWAQKAIKDARAEAGKARTTAKQQAADDARKQLAADIDKALGRGSDKPADPAELTKTISEQTGRIGDLEGSVRSLSVELAAYKAAGKHEANPAALLDSRSFLKSVEGLDPSASDFADKLDKAIKKAVDGNAQLRTGQAPRRGGGEFQGGPGAREGRPNSLSQALSRKLSG